MSAFIKDSLVACSEPEFDVTAEANVMVTMHDGVRLATEICYLLIDGERLEGKLPAVLLRTPYGRKEDAVFSLHFENHTYSDFWRKPSFATIEHMEKQVGIPALWVTSWPRE